MRARPPSRAAAARAGIDVAEMNPSDTTSLPRSTGACQQGLVWWTAAPSTKTSWRHVLAAHRRLGADIPAHRGHPRARLGALRRQRLRGRHHISPSRARETPGALFGAAARRTPAPAASRWARDGRLSYRTHRLRPRRQVDQGLADGTVAQVPAVPQVNRAARPERATAASPTTSQRPRSPSPAATRTCLRGGAGRRAAHLRAVGVGFARLEIDSGHQVRLLERQASTPVRNMHLKAYVPPAAGALDVVDLEAQTASTSGPRTHSRSTRRAHRRWREYASVHIRTGVEALGVPEALTLVGRCRSPAARSRLPPLRRCAARRRNPRRPRPRSPGAVTWVCES